MAAALRVGAPEAALTVTMFMTGFALSPIVYGVCPMRGAGARCWSPASPCSQWAGAPASSRRRSADCCWPGWRRARAPVRANAGLRRHARPVGRSAARETRRPADDASQHRAGDRTEPRRRLPGAGWLARRVCRARRRRHPVAGGHAGRLRGNAGLRRDGDGFDCGEFSRGRGRPDPAAERAVARSSSSILSCSLPRRPDHPRFSVELTSRACSRFYPCCGDAGRQ